MKICSKCGIELEDDMESCPLCGEPAPLGPEEAAHPPGHPEAPGKTAEWRRVRKRPSAGRLLGLFKRVFHV